MTKIEEKENLKNLENEKNEEIDEIFDDLPDAYTVSINRIDPSWCDGFLGTWEFSSDSPFDLNWLKNNFGGRKFRLRIKSETPNRYIKIKTVRLPDPPKREGLEIMQASDGTSRTRESMERAPAPPPPAQAAPPPPPQQDKLLEKILELVISRQQPAQVSDKLTESLLSRINALETMLFQTLSRQQAAPPPAAPQVDPLEQLKNVVNVISTLEDVRGALAPAAAAPDNALMDKAITTIIEQLGTPKPAPAPTPTPAPHGLPPKPGPLPPPPSLPQASADHLAAFKAAFTTASPDDQKTMLREIGLDLELDDLDHDDLSSLISPEEAAPNGHDEQDNGDQV